MAKNKLLKFAGLSVLALSLGGANVAKASEQAAPQAITRDTLIKAGVPQAWIDENPMNLPFNAPEFKKLPPEIKQYFIDKKLHAVFDERTYSDAKPKTRPLEELGVSQDRLKELWFDMARKGKTDMMADLIERGFDPNERDEHGYTALILATYNDHPETVTALIKRGAQACLKDNKGNTALMGAAFKGFAPEIKLLSDAGCPVNTQNAVGQTGMMMASLFGQTDAVKQLLALGANPDLQDQAGATALSLAEMQGNTAMVDLLTPYVHEGKKPTWFERLRTFLTELLRRWFPSYFASSPTSKTAPVPAHE